MILFEGAKSSKSPNSLKAKKIIAIGAASGSYMALSTIIFLIISTRTDLIPVSTCCLDILVVIF